MSRESHLNDLQTWYRQVEVYGDGEYVAIYPLYFHWTMIKGHLDDDSCYHDRWCYFDEPLVREMLEEWKSRNFEGEPLGWHRHPDTGRRRPDGDASKEYVAP